MGHTKNNITRASSERRERSGGARDALRRKLETPLYEAYAMVSICDLKFWLYTKEVVMRLADLLPSNTDSNPENTKGQVDDEFSAVFPRVWQFVSQLTDDVGKNRQTATLVFFVDAGEWKVRMSERDHRLDLWAGGSSFKAALENLEAQLSKQPVPWRKQVIPGHRGK